MQVTAVGDATENGKVYKAAQIDNSVKTPLNEQLDWLGKWVSRLSCSIGIAVVVARIMMYLVQYDFSFANVDPLAFIAYILQTLMIAMTLVVVSVPEASTYGSHTEPRLQYAPNVEDQQPGPPYARLRDNGCHHRYLHRQSRHIDTESHERRRRASIVVAKLINLLLTLTRYCLILPTYQMKLRKI